MTEKEREYLNKRLKELWSKKLDLNLQIRRVDKEIATIMKKIDKEIITDE